MTSAPPLTDSPSSPCPSRHRKPRSVQRGTTLSEPQPRPFIASKALPAAGPRIGSLQRRQSQNATALDISGRTSRDRGGADIHPGDSWATPPTSAMPRVPSSPSTTSRAGFITRHHRALASATSIAPVATSRQGPNLGRQIARALLNRRSELRATSRPVRTWAHFGSTGRCGPGSSPPGPWLIVTRARAGSSEQFGE